MWIRMTKCLYRKQSFRTFESFISKLYYVTFLSFVTFILVFYYLICINSATHNTLTCLYKAFLTPESGRLFCCVMTEDVSQFAVLSLAIKINLCTFTIYVAWLRVKWANTHGCFPGRNMRYFPPKYSDTLRWHICSTHTRTVSLWFNP